jgi:hypothetical protein
MKTTLRLIGIAIFVAAAGLALIGCSSDGHEPLNYWYNDGQVQLGPRQGTNVSQTTNAPASTNATAAMHAKTTITVQHSDAKLYDQTASPALMEIDISESFAGDIDGDSTVRALQIQRGDRSANLISMQRFRGKLGGREGTFVLQGQENVEDGKIKATWFVVPGSGTGDLARLRGQGGFEGEFGKGSAGTLDYWFN